MIIDKPFFMSNKDWYQFDYKKKIYILTDEAPEKAKESYDEFYKGLKAHYS